MKSSLLALSVLLSVVVIILFTTACSDPTLVGRDLIEEDQVNVSVVDTLTVRTFSERYDSILTYSPFESSQLDDYVIGKMTDPVFGLTESQLYAQLLLQNETLDLTDAVLDSVVLVLPIDSFAVYGSQPQEYGFEVYRIAENIDNDENFFSNERFATESGPIGSFLGNVNPFMNQPVYNPVVDSIVQVRQVRIPLTDDFAEGLFNQDSSVFRSDAAFWEYLPGIQIVGTTENTGILGFDLNPTAGIQLYYTTDTTARVFTFNFQVDGVRALNVQHDYNDSAVEEFINEPALSDSLFFIQGLGGFRGVIELPYITDLAGSVVNRAEIRVPIQDNDNDQYAPAPQVVLRYRNDAGELTDIDDLVFSVANTSVLFGGVVVAGANGDQSDYYSFNVSDHLQDMIDGRVDNRLILEVFRQDERASRSVLKGAGNSEPVEVSVVLTKL